MKPGKLSTYIIFMTRKTFLARYEDVADLNKVKGIDSHKQLRGQYTRQLPKLSRGYTRRTSRTTLEPRPTAPRARRAAPHPQRPLSNN